MGVRSDRMLFRSQMLFLFIFQVSQGSTQIKVPVDSSFSNSASCVLYSSSLLLILRLVVVAEWNCDSTSAEDTSGVPSICNYQGLHVLYNDDVGSTSNGINLGRLVASTTFSPSE